MTPSSAEGTPQNMGGAGVAAARPAGDTERGITPVENLERLRGQAAASRAARARMQQQLEQSQADARRAHEAAQGAKQRARDLEGELERLRGQVEASRAVQQQLEQSQADARRAHEAARGAAQRVAGLEAEVGRLRGEAEADKLAYDELQRQLDDAKTTALRITKQALGKIGGLTRDVCRLERERNAAREERDEARRATIAVRDEWQGRQARKFRERRVQLAQRQSRSQLYEQAPTAKHSTGCQMDFAQLLGFAFVTVVVLEIVTGVPSLAAEFLRHCLSSMSSVLMAFAGWLSQPGVTTTSEVIEWVHRALYTFVAMFWAWCILVHV